ncbi:capsule polysaccharide export protein [Prevotella dentalis DSM 3688]|uniref:Capsule polysaccharide export protein n=1 Tax=Prevotella dentalis (strain ATCC 49559 / DSM 3688 / JCM 13448 / NCTC 12043 / ES 2772) TaxID=908937 RepID=F9D0N8_PREDD|nr:chain-length determining protein [Prevotella dentalis]AGB27741.1 capsule polysaccharide export protein [Prevotella dentalis DSM 3688]EGQ16567.1 chain length determinant protein [Prevotella dentalis DSM 3688]
MNEKPQTAVIDLRLIIRRIREHGRLFAIAVPVSLAAYCLLILSMPRYYTTDTKLAPETGNATNTGSIGSLASSLGIDMSQIKSTDAITPLLYPELMEDNRFVAELFSIPVRTSEGQRYTYFDYLANRQKTPWWAGLLGKKEEPLTMNRLSPYALDKKQSRVAEAIRDNVTLKVDSKDGVITITATAQDPLVCKTLADSLSTRLKAFITAYRTDKARKDVAYYKKITQEAQTEYEKARRSYAAYSDANQDLVLQAVQSKIEDMENNMQLKFNTYSNARNQYEAARAKLQEKTPVFTLLKGASVPVKPAGPKRMLFVLIMELLTCTLLTVWAVRKDVLKIFV